DSGPGISEEETHKIFERFYQAGNIQQHNAGGTGIGLAFARELVVMHSGEITVNSLPGGGSIFKINLPAAGAGTVDSTNELILTSALKTTDEDGGPNLKSQAKSLPLVLIVEDNHEIRDYIASIVAPFCN